MSLPQAPRRGEENPRHQHFAYLKVEKGDKLFGWIAGPVMWFEMHTSDHGSKPCLSALTSGDLSCPKCKYGPPVQKGACPFYHAVDAKPYMVWLDEGQRDFYDSLGLFTRIAIGREKHKGSPVWVQKCFEQNPVWSSTLPERRRAADLTESLLRMWAMPEIDLWYRTTHGVSDKPKSLVSVAPTAPRDPNTIDPMYRAAHARAEAMARGESGIDEATARILARNAQAKPSRNGQHGGSTPTG